MSTPESDAALAANLRERALVLEQAGPANSEALLRSMDHPSWQELHRNEQSKADIVAEIATAAIFGRNTRDRLTPQIAGDLEQGATYLLRRIHPEFVKAAHEQAVETLLVSDHFARLTARRPMDAGEKRILAHWLVTEVRAAFHGVLEARIPIAPAVYLRLCAAKAARGAL